MRVVIQKVQEAAVTVATQVVGQIDKGYLILVGYEAADSEEDIHWICNKIVNLRLFEDEMGKMNLSLQDVAGNILLVSQFTLHAATKKGNRPSFIKAAKPEQAIALYEKTIEKLSVLIQKPIETGQFGKLMKVELTNDGPVTILLDSKNKGLF